MHGNRSGSAPAVVYILVLCSMTTCFCSLRLCIIVQSLLGIRMLGMKHVKRGYVVILSYFRSF